MLTGLNSLLRLPWKPLLLIAGILTLALWASAGTHATNLRGLNFLHAPQTVEEDGLWPDKDANGSKLSNAPPVPADQRDLLRPKDALPAAQARADLLGPPGPLVQQVAAALGNDPLAIYNYVKTEIAYVPVYGSLRDARRTILERSGTDADQSLLLVELLQAASVDASFLYGTVTLPLDLAASWVRVEEGPSVADTCERVRAAFAYGGVPIVDPPPCADNVTEEFGVQHVWVAADIGGEAYELDPSVKHNDMTDGIDIATALGYDRAAFLAGAEAGATITATSVTNLNASNIAADLDEYAANLIAQIETSDDPHAYVEDIVGGWNLAEPAADILPQVLPYPRTIAATLADFDDPAAPELRHKVAIEVRNSGGTPVITHETTLPDIAGHRLTYMYSNCFFTCTGTLRLEGGSLGSTSTSIFSYDTIRFCIDAPFAAYGGSYGDQCTNRNVRPSTGNTYALVTEVGRTPDGLLAERRSILAANQAAFPAGSEQVLGETLNVLGLSWFNEADSADRLHEAIARVNDYRIYGMAVMSQETATQTGFGIDARLNFSDIYSPTASSEDRYTCFRAATAQGSGMEHAFIEQLQDKEAISTIRALEIANSSMPVFLGTPDNWCIGSPEPNPPYDSCQAGSVRPQLSYSSTILSGLDSYIAAGWSLVVPRTNVTLNSWSGTGFIGFTGGGEAYMITGALSGGYSTEPGSADAEDALDALGDLLRQTIGRLPGAGWAVRDPVDSQTGAFKLAETDLSVADRRPLSIEDFGRFYNSRARNVSGPFGFGWRNTYGWTLNVYSAYTQGLEGPKAVDAARLISQVFVLQDLFRNPDLDSLQHERRTIAALAIKWGTDQLTDNAYALTGPDGANGAFLKLPGGHFSSSARLPWDLIENPDGSITLDGRAREGLHFEKVVSGEGKPSWRLASWKDGNGNTLTLTYDAPGPEGTLQEVTDAASRTLTFTYTGDLITQVTDPAGRVHEYGYDGEGNLTTHTDPRGTLTPENPDDYVTTYTYGLNPDQHLLDTIIDPEGNTFLTNIYDGDGRVTQQRDGRLNDAFLYYGDHLTRVVDPLGNDRVVSWADDGRLQKVTDEAGFTKTTHFDASGNTVKVEEPEGAISTFAYDPDDNLVESTDPLGNVTELEYDSDSRVTLIRDPELHETTFDYEGGPNLKRTTNALGQVMSFEYYLPSGRPKDIFEPLTNANTHMTYDSFGNPKTVTNDELETTTFYYNAVDELVGHRTSETDHLGNTTSYEYDPAGNTTKVTDPLGHATDFEYDGNNLLRRVTDPKGRVTQNDYDAMNNLDLITRADTTTIDFDYDPNNLLTTLVDPRGNPWTFERNDPRGLVTAEVDPLGNRREFEYDGLGRLHKRTDAEERVTDYVWDAASRLTDVLYDDGSAVHNTYYDDGLLDTSSYKDWNADYDYDALHRLIVEDYPYLGRRVEHTWDEAPGLQPSPGDRVMLELKAGGFTMHTVTYEYDDVHRLKLMTDDTGVTSYDYDDAGRLTEATLPNGASIEQTYDAASRIMSIINKNAGGDPFATFQYFDPDPSSPLYDEADNVTGVVHITPQSSLTTRYVYDVDPESPLDDLDRLREEQTPRGTVAYTYDDAGNRETRTDAAGTTLYTYDNANQLLTAGSTTYDYDNNGNLKSKTIPGIGTTTFDWDHENRLVGIHPPAGPAVTFAYDPFGRQVLRQEEGEAPVHATYDGLKLLAEGAPDLASGFVYGGGVRRMEYRRDLNVTATRGYAIDRLGSVTNLTDATSTPRDAYRYDAFGTEALAAGIDSNAFRFGGSFGAAREPAMPGLVKMGFRYYDAEAGRFISRDPVGFLGGDTNLYAYVGSNPATFADPYGLMRGNPLDWGGSFLDWMGKDYHWATVAAIVAGYATTGSASAWAIPHLLHSETNNSQPKTMNPPGRNPAKPAGEGWEWKGPGPQGSPEGSWVRKGADGIEESLHPDLGHGGSEGPHWDYNTDPRNPLNPKGWRVDPDTGKMTPKK